VINRMSVGNTAGGDRPPHRGQHPRRPLVSAYVSAKHDPTEGTGGLPRMIYRGVPCSVFLLLVFLFRRAFGSLLRPTRREPLQPPRLRQKRPPNAAAHLALADA
jgi:hypothetical protein